jgi:catechol 2,3-dioxygenase-like lactoylglutathione lyase family enzyme
MLKLEAIHHVRFAVRDLDASERFALDFGLTVASRSSNRVFMRGTGSDAYSYVAERGERTQLLGIAFAVESRDELSRAVAEFGASPMRPLDGPGGGYAVSLRDPDGTPIDLISQIAPALPVPLRPDIRYNTGLVKSRRGARQLMPDRAPPQVIRLGHAGIFVTDFARSVEWYTRTLGLLLSDGVHMAEGGKTLAAFYRLNRGDEWVDHHSIAMFAGATPGIQHISFEVQDIEAQLLAHEWLSKRGWQPLWGVGRHGLGSHIFDVWWEPNDIRFETFTDTDLCSAERPGEIFPVTDNLTRWGPQMPAEYVMPRGTPGLIGR